MKNSNFHTTVSINLKWHNHLGKLVTLKINHLLPTGSNHSTPRCLPKRNDNTCPHKELYINGHSLSTYRQKQEMIWCPPTGEWMDKQTMYVHSMEFYPVIKRNELLSHVIVYINIKIVLLSNISHAKHVYISYDSTYLDFLIHNFF